ncbi:MAG: methylmalonyl-CoA mutase [Deltaproteobacteria bacterium]|nr:methylmalonyl-CoA mutase [Deltaproteobacteria bacterium]
MYDRDTLDEIKKAKEEWDKETAKGRERKDRFTTMGGIDVDRLYTPLDVEERGIDYMRDISLPGQYPYTRGIHPTMYRGRLWTVRQFMGFGDPSKSNERLKYLMKSGAPGLNVAFDLPTINGLGSDHPLSRGEIGRDGVPVNSLEDMEALFDGIPLGDVSSSLVIAYPPIPCMYIAVAEKQGFRPDQLRGTYQNDSICRDVAANVRVIPRRAELKLTVDVVEHATKYMPLWYPISIVGYQIREKGCTAAQEVGFTLSDGIEFVNAFIERGMDVDTFGPRLSFMWNAHNDFFEEIAKYRAARRIWARIMKERFKAKNPRSMQLRFHTQTSGVSLTAQQPMNNAVRVAIQGLAAVLGGTQSLHTDSIDEAMALPTEESVKLAVRTQHVIAHESGVANTVDPMAGSFFVESLTKDIEDEAMAYIEEIDKRGGVIECIDNGYIQSEVTKSAFAYQTKVEKKEEIIVGVNDFIEDEEAEPNLLEIDEGFERRMVQSLEDLKASRDQSAVDRTLDKLREAAFRDENLMDTTMEAAKAYATLRELWDVYKERWGSFDEKSHLTGI